MNLITLLVIFLPVILITAITPYITRKTESFGVTIPSDMYDDPTFSKFRKSYATQTTILGLIIFILLAVTQGSFNENTWYILFTVGIFVFLIGQFIIYFIYHKKMKQLKEEKNWFENRKEKIVVDLKFYSEKKTHSNLWFAIPLLITIGTAIFTFMNYDKFPEQLPMQYNFEGEVTRYATKSVGSLLAFPLLQLFMTGVFLLTNIIISKSKQQIDPQSPEESLAQNMIFRRCWSLFTIISGTALVLLFSLTNVSFLIDIHPNLILALTLILTGIIVMGAVIITILTGQGGSRVKIGYGKDGEVINRDEDKYWKLGIFYFNPEDPALFVEKRFGSGWTANFAKPIVWVIFIGILLVPLAISLLTS